MCETTMGNKYFSFKCKNQVSDIWENERCQYSVFKDNFHLPDKYEGCGIFGQTRLKKRQGAYGPASKFL